MKSSFTVLGVSRGGEFSPNMQGSDAAIFNAVACHLANYGYRVEVCSEYEFASSNRKADVIFTMARSLSAIKCLEEAERDGAIVVNPSSGLRNAVRLSMTRCLMKASVPHPESWIVLSPDSQLPCFEKDDAYWVKRADGCAQIAEDVCFVRSADELNASLEAFRERGVNELVINRHLEGDLVKFYGVYGTDFFHSYYPSDDNHSKFGLEQINGAPHHYSFSVDRLHEIANRASDVLSIPVYGGDCIVAPDGEIKIIDFNDWPSFSRCRDEASLAIAQCIKQTIIETKQ